MNSPMPARAHLNIGEVLACLRPDFPDVTISKIRFLEAAGLVTPARTSAGYRKFSDPDVERLRYVLTAQRDHYLPLKVIKDQLDAISSAREPLPATEGAGVTPIELTRSELRMDREQMLAETGLDADALAAIDASGLLQRRRGGHYDADDVAIATIVAEIGRSGLEPRHLRAFKGAADREVGLIEQTVATADRRRGEVGRARTEAAATELATQFARLHAALLRAGLRHTLTA